MKLVALEIASERTSADFAALHAKVALLPVAPTPRSPGWAKELEIYTQLYQQEQAMRREHKELQNDLVTNRAVLYQYN